MEPPTAPGSEKWMHTQYRIPFYILIFMPRSWQGLEILRKLTQTGMKMNDRKIEILTHMSDGDWWTSKEIALWCGINLTNSSELLRRYRNQGLVTRVRNYDVPRGYKYRITNVGLDRLQYLYSPTIKTSSAIADRAGVSGSDKRVLDRWIKQKMGR